MKTCPRLLVVDGASRSGEPLREYLGRNGYDVRTAGSALQARVIVADQAPDLVLLDVRVPGEDVSLASWLRRHSPATGAIMLTAAARAADRVKGLDAALSERRSVAADRACRRDEFVVAGELADIRFPLGGFDERPADDALGV